MRKPKKEKLPEIEEILTLYSYDRQEIIRRHLSEYLNEWHNEWLREKGNTRALSAKILGFSYKNLTHRLNPEFAGFASVTALCEAVRRKLIYEKTGQIPPPPAKKS